MELSHRLVIHNAETYLEFSDAGYERNHFSSGFRSRKMIDIEVHLRRCSIRGVGVQFERSSFTARNLTFWQFNEGEDISNMLFCTDRQFNSYGA